MDNSLDFDIIHSDKKEFPLKSMKAPLINNEDVSDFGHIDGKKKDSSYLEFQSCEDPDVYYRLGIIDFL